MQTANCNLQQMSLGERQLYCKVNSPSESLKAAEALESRKTEQDPLGYHPSHRLGS